MFCRMMVTCVGWRGFCAKLAEVQRESPWRRCSGASLVHSNIAPDRYTVNKPKTNYSITGQLEGAVLCRWHAYHTCAPQKSREAKERAKEAERSRAKAGFPR